MKSNNKSKTNNKNNNKTKTKKNSRTNFQNANGGGFIFSDNPINQTPNKYICQYNNNAYKFRLKCLCCRSNNKLFYIKTIKQETTQLQFFNMGELARNAIAFICNNCGFMQTYDSTVKYTVEQ
jgi:hypothetical protein